MSLPFPNQGEYLAGSLEISYDIYRMPLLSKGMNSAVTGTGSKNTGAKNTGAKGERSKRSTSQSRVSRYGRSTVSLKEKPLSEIMSEVGAGTCNCADPNCENKDTAVGAFKQTNLFVEKREGQDSLFLDEDDLAPTISEEKSVKDDKEQEKMEDPVGKVVMSLVARDSLKGFDPFN